MTKIEQLKKVTNEIDDLLEKRVDNEDEDFIIWKVKSESIIKEIYGPDSEEYKKLKETIFGPLIISSNADNDYYIKICSEDLIRTRAEFKAYIEILDNDTQNDETKDIVKNYERIFLVHGHDGEIKQSVARIIEKQGINAVILSEQINQGKTVIEKIEENSDVGAAVCLFTNDDKCIDNGEEKYRARQNVVFETGYFIGLLGRKNVICIFEDGVEIPSDMSGIVYTDKEKCELNLLRELKTMGFNIDMNKLL